MKKNHAKNFITFLFISLILFNITNCKTLPNQQQTNTIQETENELKKLLATVRSNLAGTTVLEDFEEEQNAWEDYKAARLETLFPQYIDGIKMEWGSILSHEITAEIIRLNEIRISEIKLFLDNQRVTGTDGKGEFKEYVTELKMIVGS